MRPIYPPDLVQITVDRWKRYQRMLQKGKVIYERNNKHSKNTKEPHIPFPTDDQLKIMLDIMYHVSFLTEETRRIAVRVAYLTPSTSENIEHSQLVNKSTPVPFNYPIPFSVSEILKLAPALDPRNSILAICPAETIKISDPKSPLVIWGILNLGYEWWRLVSHRETSAIAPPNCLTLSTFAPGSLTASTIGHMLFRLRAGELMALPLENLSDGYIGEFFESSAELLYSQVCNELHIKKYDSQPDTDDHPRHLYFGTISKILAFTQELRHGGTFIIIPDEIGMDDSRLTDRISIKYQLSYSEIWEELIEEAVANWHYFKLLFPKRFQFLTDTPHASAKDLKSLISWEHRQRHAQESIEEFSQFVASLSGVDGAVVITKSMKLLGFGAEITATSPSLRTVDIAEDPQAKKVAEKLIESFGTRHRSAIRLCSSFDDSVCFVVSQDGTLRAIKRIGSKVVIWNDVNIAVYGI